MPSPAKRLAIFVSGRGSNFMAIREAISSGKINGEVTLVVTNDLMCLAAVGAAADGIELVAYPAAKLPADGLRDLMLARRIDFGILAGYIKLVPPSVITAFFERIINIHPGPLPQFGGKGFYGRKVHEAVLASGVKQSGPTVHFVDEAYDHGAVLATSPVDVLPTDTPESLAKRVLAEEHRLYPTVVAALCRDELKPELSGKFSNIALAGGD